MKLKDLFEFKSLSSLTVDEFKDQMIEKFGEDGMKVRVEKKPPAPKEYQNLGTFYKTCLEMPDASARQISQVGEFVKQSGFSTVDVKNITHTNFYPAKGQSSKIHSVSVEPDKGDLFVWITGYDKEVKFEFESGDDKMVD
jgi:hypothetical protein